MNTENEKLIDIEVTALHSTICFKNKIRINGKIYEFSGKISKISSNNKFCLILLENGDIFQHSFVEKSSKKLNFVNVEGSNNGNVKQIACNEAFSVAVTDKGVIYNIPNKTFEFPKHVRVKKIVCGFEHCLLLTTNGDVYSWGTGL